MLSFKVILRAIIALCLLSFLSKAEGQGIFKKSLSLMGSDFEITLVAANSETADVGFDLAIQEIVRIENLISSWKDDSQTTMINKSAGKEAVVVSKELFDLIQRSIAISKITDGAFDISYAAMDPIWKFNGEMKSLPSESEIASSVAKVGYVKIELNKENSSVFLKETGMKIGFGAIGKGYAADRAKEILKKNGFDSGIINASGDMNVWGHRPNGDAWKVAITNPKAKEKAFALLPTENKAVVTSGNYEKYLIIYGQRYSHIIDPRTGYPSKGIISVTVFASKAELADAMATAAFVMGIETAIDRFNQIEGLECLIVDEDGNIHQSEGIDINTTK